MSPRSKIASFFLGLVTLLTIPSCAPKATAAKPATTPTRTTAWLQVLIDDTSDPQIRIRPSAAAQDAVFGPLLRRGEREAAAAIGNVLVGESSLTVFEKSEMVTIAARHLHPLDAVIVFAGVPGSIAPESMVDERGLPLWRKVDARVRGTDEYARLHRTEDDVTEIDPRLRLVVIGGSTWVMALGPAVERTFSALAIGTPDALHPDPGPLAQVVAVGELLEALKRGRRFPDFAETLGSLERADLTLDGGKAPDAKLVLSFQTADGATRGEDLATTLLRIFKEKWPKHRAILDGIVVGRRDRKVTVDAPVPPLVVEMLTDAEKPATAL